MDTLKIALDKTARRMDIDGRLHIDRSHISKAAVNPYYGHEIPNWEELGLIPDQIYKLLRDPVELARAAPSFERLPILSKHVPITVARIAEDPELKQLIIGAIGSDVEFADPYLDGDLTFWDANAIGGIDSDAIKELSCGYRYAADMTPGTYEGEAYDGVMRNIRGNHLALVEVGRAGPDVVVADENPFTIKESAMKLTKLGKALIASLCAASPVLAADSALPALVGNATRKNLNKAEVIKKLIALDATLSPQQLDNVIDALLDVEQENPAGSAVEPGAEPVEPVAEDESPVEQLRKLLSGKVDDSVIDQACALFDKPAMDEEDNKGDKDDDKKQEIGAAMDSLRREFREANQARIDVRAVVGEVIGMDSAEQIYRFALDQMKVDHKGVSGAVALGKLFKVAESGRTENKTVTHIAQDSAGLAERFPGVARFNRA